MNHLINRYDPALFHDQMIGKLAVNYKLLSKEDYTRAVNLQRDGMKSGMYSSLTEVLIQHKYLSHEEIELLKQVKELITEMRKEKRFGVIAVKNGFVSESQLNLALKVQKREKKSPRKKRSLGLANIKKRRYWIDLNTSALKRK